MTEAKSSVDELVVKAINAIKKNQLDVAEGIAAKLLVADQDSAEGHRVNGCIAQKKGDKKTAVTSFHAVTKHKPDDVRAWVNLAISLCEFGYLHQSEKAISNAELLNSKEGDIQNEIGMVWTYLGEHERALSFFEQATDAEPQNSLYWVNTANSYIFVGDFHRAEECLENALSIEPENSHAHYARSSLRKAKSDTYAKTLTSLASKHADHSYACSQFSYAAGKQYEDLEMWDEAFQSYSKASRIRRSAVAYNENKEIELFSALQSEFTHEWIKSGTHETSNTIVPIFIVGQPRTGTTLIDSILSSHESITSAGELQHFRFALYKLARAKEDVSPSALVKDCSKIDPVKLGEEYLSGTKKYCENVDFFIDKMPTNYLYLPLIAKALPNAKFVHVQRDPIDTCFAMYKQLFVDTYKYSYQLDELGRHYLRYKKLINSWSALLGDRLHHVSYEDVVSNTEHVARGLIDFIGLPWSNACLGFHERPIVSTASSVQVRQPIYSNSVGRWRKYEKQLLPLLSLLSSNN